MNSAYVKSLSSNWQVLKFPTKSFFIKSCTKNSCRDKWIFSNCKGDYDNYDSQDRSYI